jgi:phage shock protein E
VSSSASAREAWHATGSDLVKYAHAVLAAILILVQPSCSPGEQPPGTDALAQAAGTAGAGNGPQAVAPRRDAAAPGSASAGDVIYLDVRTPGEFAAGHVQGTLHIPVDELGRRVQELEPYRDRQIVVYCRTGRRSANAIDLLAARGFRRLENGGGLDNMAARGLTVTRQATAR